MRYTISEMARLLGVTTHMLRYYEKIGILRPTVNPENGYRYYSVLDTRRFNYCRQLFTSGIPLEDCALIMQDLSHEDIDRLIDERLRQKERDMELEKAAIENLRTLRENMRQISQRRDEAWVEQYPKMWRLNCSEVESPLPDPALEEERAQWLACLPAVKWSSKISRQTLLSGRDQPVFYEYGLMCEERWAKTFALEQTQRVEIVPGGDYLVTLQRKEEREPFGWKHCEALTRHMDRLGITVHGDMFCETIASRVEQGAVINYHLLRVKIYT